MADTDTQKAAALQHEHELIDLMIDMYEKAQSEQQKAFDTAVLRGYAHQRIERCAYRKEPVKPFCNVCPIHCYKKEMREQIKVIMRYSGPRLLFRHPVLSIRHLISTLKAKIQPPRPPRSTARRHTPN